MTGPWTTVRRADTGDFDRIEDLLEANGLPHRDVRTGPARFFVFFSGSEFLGVGGLETYGSTGLLRSVVVDESVRGRGFGTALYGELEAHARDDGVDTLYLLTTTASGFFRRCGYVVVDRERAPPRVQQTTEFADLCPASAVCMRKDLGRG